MAKIKTGKKVFDLTDTIDLNAFWREQKTKPILMLIDSTKYAT